MKILIVGADGFIGLHLAFGFRTAGHEVVASARRTTRLTRMGFACLKADLGSPQTHDPEFWRKHIQGVTHVVNAAGLLNGSAQQFDAVHLKAPKALYDALPKNTPILLISAISIDDGNSAFARVRIKGEELVHKYSGTALRPGLVLGDTSYGGSSLGRALAALPWITPLIEGGNQKINPIHANDLARVALDLLVTPQPKTTLEVGGAETITQSDMLSGYRSWLGLAETRRINMPRNFAKFAGRIGDLLKLGPISSTFLSMLDAGALATTSPEIKTPIRGFSEFLWQRPVGTQDIWHARLYFPALLARMALALLWLVSGMIGLLYPAETILTLEATQGLSDSIALALARFGGLLDLIIGWAVFRGWRPKFWGFVQLAMVLGYTVGLTILDLSLWSLPFGGVLKNLPILVLILLHMTFADER